MPDLEELFHPDIVVVGADLARHAEGREACLRGFAEFVERAALRTFEPEKPRVDVFGDAAVAGYAYRIEYLLDGQVYREGGHDVWLFVRAGGEWLAAWRMLSSAPLPAAGAEEQAAGRDARAGSA